MKRRRRMSKRGSRKSFRRNAGTHRLNVPRGISRGGFRL